MTKTSTSAGSLMIGVPLLGQTTGWLTKPAAMGYFHDEFGIDDSLCLRVLETALSNGGDFADLYFEHTLESWLILEDGKVNRSYSNILLGVGIRTVKGEQVGYAFTQELEPLSMIRAAKTAAALVNESATVVSHPFSTVAKGNFYPFDHGPEIPLRDKLPLIKAVNDRCFINSPSVVKVNAGFYDSVKRIMVVTSEGIKAEDILPRNYLFATVVAEKKGRTEQVGLNYGGRHNFSWYTGQLAEQLANEATQRAEILFDAVQPPAGEIPVVLGPGVTGILLHEAIGHGMEADFNRKKISTYTEMIGKKVAHPSVTIVDDGTNPQQLGSVNFDDEGSPSRSTVLVEKGILTGYLHDKISARHYGVEPTGNGRRQSFEHYPMPRMRNTYMLSGQEMPEDIIKAAKNGIYVENVSNGQVKIGEGDFAFYVSQGRLIKDGRLTVPIKDINIIGNGPRMLENIIMVGNDMKLHNGGGGSCGKNGQGVPVSFGLPTCLVKSMTVGGTQQKGGGQ